MVLRPAQTVFLFFDLVLFAGVVITRVPVPPVDAKEMPETRIRQSGHVDSNPCLCPLPCDNRRQVLPVMPGPASPTP